MKITNNPYLETTREYAGVAVSGGIAFVVSHMALVVPVSTARNSNIKFKLSTPRVGIAAASVGVALIAKHLFDRK